METCNMRSADFLACLQGAWINPKGRRWVAPSRGPVPGDQHVSIKSPRIALHRASEKQVNPNGGVGLMGNTAMRSASVHTLSRERG